MALQLRRGTNKERLQITPAEGELIFVTDWELETVTGTSIDGTTETITFSAAHGLSINDQVLFQSATQLGLTLGTVYHVISAGLTTTACRLSLSSGGAAVDLTTGSALSLTFAKSPTTAAGVPVGTNVTALWIGDGSTPGGIPGNTQGLNDLTDVVITTPNEGQTLYYDATTSQWKNTSILEVNDVSNRIEVAGNIQATGDLILNSDLGSNDVIITFTSGRELKWDHSDQRYEFNTGDLYLTSDLIIGGNSIKASDGLINIEMTSNTLTEVKGDLQVTGNDIKNSTGTTIITFSGNNTVLSGDLEVQGQDIKSNGGTTAITLSGTEVTVAGNLNVHGQNIVTNQTTMNVFNTNATTVNAFGAATALTIGNSGGTTTISGNLTVNGTTTTIESTTLVVDDPNIVIGKDNTTDAQANGGGITLKGATDKEIKWRDSDDRWTFDNGDGTEYVIPVNLTDLNDVTISSANKGQVLYYDGSGFVNTSTIQFDSGTYRPRFQSNNTTSATISSGLIAVKNTGSTNFTTGDGSGILIAVDDDSNPINIFAGLSAAYSSTGNHEARLRSSTDAFATVDKNLLAVNDDDLKVRAKEFIFNAEGTGSAAMDAQITVERGTTGADAYVKWDETNDFWVVSNGFKSEGNITTDADLIANGNLFLNNDGGANNVTITFKDSPGPTNKTITWSDSNNQFEISDQLYAGGAVIANGNLATNGNDIYFNYDDGGAGATSSVIVRRGANADVALRWNETDDRWETTIDGSSYIQLPNQDLDTDASPTFAGVTGGNVRVGVTGDNEIDTSSGGLTIDSAGGTVTVDDDLVVSGGLNVDAGVLFVDAANNYVGINDATPGKALDVVGEIRSDTNVLTPKVELNSAATLDAFTSTTTSTSQFTLADTTGDVLKVIIHMSLGTQRHCVEALAMKYGASTAGLTTYAELNTVAGGAPIANFAADVSAGSLRILATPTSSSSTTFKVVRTQVA